MSYGVGCRRGLDRMLLLFWCRPAAAAPVGPLAWEPPYAARGALEKAKRPKKKKRIILQIIEINLFHILKLLILYILEAFVLNSTHLFLE